MSTIHERIASLSPTERSELLSRLFKTRRTEDSVAESDFPKLRIDLPNRYEAFPLTELQEAYWIGRSGAFDVGDVSAHSYWEFENSGLDLARLEEAWGRLIRRHDALRLVFLPDARQKILRDVPHYRIRILDLSAESERSTERQLEAVRKEMSHQVMPSDRWPLFDIRCARLSGGRMRLFFSFDGLIVDSWSIGILFKELNSLYSSPETELKPIDPSFRDYVVASVDFRTSAPYETSREYWRERLTQLPPAPELPRRDWLARRTGSKFTRRTARLEPELWARLQQRAAEAGTTSTGVLLAAYAEVIGHWSKNPRFTLNVPLFNRLPLHPEINEVVGEFASFTLLEVDNSGSAGFGERAKRLQERLWSDLNHSAFSGVEVLRQLAKTRGLGPVSVMPIVFTSLCHNRTPIEGIESADYGVLGEKVFTINQTPQVWLDNHVSGMGGALICDWDSIDDLFADGCTEGLFDSYRRLLYLLATDPKPWGKSSVELARALGAGPERYLVEETEIPPRVTGTIAQISRIVCDVLELSQIDPTAGLLSLGANSIDFVRISNRLEGELGYRPKIEDLFKLQSVAALASAFDSQSNEGRLSSDAGVPNAPDSVRSRLAAYKVMLDPKEREQFKNSRAGVRRDVAAHPSIEFERPEMSGSLVASYQRRRSYRRFMLKPISQDQFAGFLSCLSEVRLEGKPKFLYASPGGLNPTQAYLHVKAGRIEGVPAGAYYYDPEKHCLVTLAAGVSIDRNVHLPFINQPIFDEAAFSVFLIADLDAIGPAYGERSLHYVTLEAGIMAHQLEVWGPDYQIGLCQIGAMDFEKIRSHFALGPNHVFVHSLLGGMIPPKEEMNGEAKQSTEARPTDKAKRLIERIKGLSQEEVKKLLMAERNSHR